MPTSERLAGATPHLVTAYGHYDRSGLLTDPFRDDVSRRFAFVQLACGDLPGQVARAAVNFMETVAEFRNLARF